MTQSITKVTFEDEEFIKSQGFPDEALDDPTFIEAISRPVKQDYEIS